MKIKKILRILLVVGLVLLALGLLLPAVTLNGDPVVTYGEIITVALIGGVVIYFIALPFVVLLILSNHKMLSRVGQCLGLGVALINFYAFALVIQDLNTNPALTDAEAGFGLVISFVGALILLGVIVTEIVFELIGLKIDNTHKECEILIWKDLLDKEVITKAEFEEKKKEILQLDKKPSTLKKEKAVKQVPPEVKETKESE